MENKSVTAVEWLVEQVAGRGLDCGSGIRMKIQVPNDIAEQAKQMFEQQIKDAHCEGQYPFENIHNAEQYYNETFKKD
jgi:hypothetical protein